MENTYVSPEGNPEIWAEKPEGYFTEDEWAELQKPPLEAEKAKAIEALRLKKWEMKEAGITVNGIAIDTDDRGQATINGAVTNCLINPAFTTNWKTSAVDENGASVWMQLGKDLILALSHALTSYTEACFAVEAHKQDEIAGLATVEEIENWLVSRIDEGWPSREINLG